MTGEPTTEPCPFGCDEPWPHGPGGCVFRLDDESWAELQRVLNDPPKPNPALIALMRGFPDVMIPGAAPTNPTDTRWTALRWRIAIWLLWRALRIAPDGSAACDLEDHLMDWSAMCQVDWHERYPCPANAQPPATPTPGASGAPT